jgi:hypothetical protein
MQSCLSQAFEAIGEGIEEASEKDPNETPEERLLEQRRSQELLGAEMAICTRRAKNCQERLNCTRGIFLPPAFPAGDPGLPPAPPLPPPPPPAWDGESARRSPILTGPWDGGRVSLMPGVDSPSCARCTIERCPDPAFACFGAAGNSAACPNGDCCEDLRRCIHDCGGYGEGDAGAVAFPACLFVCEKTRPHALQQLAALQSCAKNECAGCETFDIIESDAGASP